MNLYWLVTRISLVFAEQPASPLTVLQSLGKCSLEVTLRSAVPLPIHDCFCDWSAGSPATSKVLRTPVSLSWRTPGGWHTVVSSDSMSLPEGLLPVYAWP